MAQFHVYRNRNAATQKRYPLLLDVQSDLLEPLGTRVVVPLSPASTSARAAMKTLMPLLRVDGKDFIAITPQLAGIAAKELGPSAANLAAERDAIVAALDFLFHGV
jgi:toxin CcdB